MPPSASTYSAVNLNGADSYCVRHVIAAAAAAAASSRTAAKVAAVSSDAEEAAFVAAQRALMSSLAAYSIACYLLQVRLRFAQSAFIEC